MTKVLQINKKVFLQYPNIPSAIHSVPHGGLSIPKTSKSFIVKYTEEESQGAASDEPIAVHDLDYLLPITAELHIVKQMELSDLIQDLNLPMN